MNIGFVIQLWLPNILGLPDSRNDLIASVHLSKMFRQNQTTVNMWTLVFDYCLSLPLQQTWEILYRFGHRQSAMKKATIEKRHQNQHWICRPTLFAQYAGSDR